MKTEANQIASTETPSPIFETPEKPGLYKRGNEGMHSLVENHLVASTVVLGVVSHQVNDRIVEPLIDKAVGYFASRATDEVAASVAQESTTNLMAMAAGMGLESCTSALVDDTAKGLIGGLLGGSDILSSLK